MMNHRPPAIHHLEVITPSFQNHLAALRRSGVILTGIALFISGVSAYSQRTEETPRPQFRTTAPDLVNSEPLSTSAPGAYDPRSDYSYHNQAAFRRTRGIPVPNPQVLAPTPTIRADSFQFGMGVKLPSFNESTSILQRGVEPQDAHLKIGPAYFKLTEISAGLLFSDNINVSQTNRESGVIGIVRVGGKFTLQLTEGFQLAASGSLIFLPFTGDTGISGFGSGLPLGLGIDNTPNFRTQASWTTQIAGWPVIFADDFRVGVGNYNYSFAGNFNNFIGAQDGAVDRAGRYSFRIPSQGNDQKDDFTNQELESSFIYFSNIVSATTERVLPNQIQVRARAYHENLWYNQGRRGLPSLRDGINLHLQDVNPNVRFQPFLDYRMQYTDVRPGVDNALNVGVTGPITDQLHLLASAGVFFSGSGNVHSLFRLELDHVAGPYTTETLRLYRSLSEFNDEIQTGISYNLHQILGPRFTGDFFTNYSRTEDELGVYNTYDQLLVGLHFSLAVGPRTRLDALGAYRNLMHGYGGEDVNDWLFSIQAIHQWTETFSSRILYRYHDRISTEQGRSYYENFLYLTLTKEFR